MRPRNVLAHFAWPMALALLATTSPLRAQDTDGDGVPDEFDACSNTPPDVTVETEGRPLGDLDKDCDTDMDDLVLFQRGFTGPMAQPPPPGMVLIPGGEFLMGDTFAEGDSAELPLHTVHLSPCYMHIRSDERPVRRCPELGLYGVWRFWLAQKGNDDEEPATYKCATRQFRTCHAPDGVLGLRRSRGRGEIRRCRCGTPYGNIAAAREPSEIRFCELGSARVNSA